jgi:predicted MPP superfamily phosphohydrolase
MSRGEWRVAFASWAAVLVSVGCFLWGVLFEANWVEATHVTVETAKLSPGQHLRIVHISDLHADGPSQGLRKAAQLIAEAHPDIIVFTGDTLNTNEALGVFHRFMQSLQAPLGRLAVRGNHDVWYRSGLPLFAYGTAVELVPSQPWRVPGLPVAFCGAPYGVTGNLKECLREAGTAFRVLAYHTPDLVEGLAGEADLYLAGHTHGGQVRVPGYGALVTLSRFDKKYEAGKYQVGGTTLYVNRGIGFEVEAPRVRFWCRPEVTVIDVVGRAALTR